MLVEMDTGTYDDSAEYTAHDLAADHWWISAGYVARVVGGSVDWEHAEYRGRSANVLLWRLIVKGGLQLRLRYADPETRCKLIKLEN